jgi:hypothetical protein
VRGFARRGFNDAICDAALAAAVTEMPAIVPGDLNVLEPDQLRLPAPAT